MSETDVRIARHVSQLAKQNEITLKDLAERLQLPYRSVQNYLTGEVKIPAYFVERCCDYFEVEADYILFGKVGVDVVAIEDAVRAILSSVIPRLELNGSQLIVSKEGKPPLSERSQFHHDAAVVGELAMAMRAEYEHLRALAVAEHGRGNIYTRKLALEAGLVSPNPHD